MGKVDISKMPTVNPQLTHFFNKYLYIHNFFVEKWVSRCHFFIDDKNLQKLDLTLELLSVRWYYMIIPSFESQTLVLQLVK